MEAQVVAGYGWTMLGLTVAVSIVSAGNESERTLRTWRHERLLESLIVFAGDF